MLGGKMVLSIEKSSLIGAIAFVGALCSFMLMYAALERIFLKEDATFRTYRRAVLLLIISSTLLIINGAIILKSEKIVTIFSKHLKTLTNI